MEPEKTSETPTMTIILIVVHKINNSQWQCRLWRYIIKPSPRYQMKNLSIAVVLLASGGAASSSSKDIILGQVKEKLFAVPSSHSRSRMLQLSDACIAANEALAQDPIFIAAMQEAQSSCPQATTMTENSMSIDFSVCPNIKDDLVELCDAVNGKQICVE